MPDPTSLHATQQKFELPTLLVKDFAHWSVTLRRHQVTLGSLVLIAKSDATSWSDLSQEAFTELKTVTSSIEGTLKSLFAYDKINYLMLMMVDPQAHFHVLPRYEQKRSFEGLEIEDAGWPKTPDLGSGTHLDDDMARRLIAHFQSGWQD